MNRDPQQRVERGQSGPQDIFDDFLGRASRRAAYNCLGSALCFKSFQICGGEQSMARRIGFAFDPGAVHFDEDNRFNACLFSAIMRTGSYLASRSIRVGSGDVNVHAVAERELRRLSES